MRIVLGRLPGENRYQRSNIEVAQGDGEKRVSAVSKAPVCRGRRARVGHPAEYHAMENVAEPAMDYAPHFLLYNRTVNPWGRDRELPQLAKETFREWYLANRSEQSNVQH